MSSFVLRLAACAACVCAALGTVAHSATVTQTYANSQRNEFFNNNAEGWFWYIDPAPEPEPTEEKKEEPQPAPSQPAQPTPPAPFSLAWVKQMLPKYLEKAWNDPTPENVEAYFLIQRFTLDKANAFSDMAERVVVGNVALDETMRRPHSMGGAAQTNFQVIDTTNKLAKKVAERAGIWFFFRSDCRYCEIQAPVIANLEHEGFSVTAISIDGGELQSYKFKRTYQDAGHAMKLNVTATPSIYLVGEDGHFDLLARSVTALSDIKHRMILLAVRNGWMTEEEANQAKPILNPNNQLDLGKEFPKLLEAAADPTKLFTNEENSEALKKLSKTDIKPEDQILNQDNFIEPNKLIELINSHKQTGVLNEKDQQQLSF